MNLYEKLQHVQCEMKAPKNLYNSFGKYKYRNAEGILEAVKPFLDKYKLSLVVYDEIEEHGNRVYVKAVCELYDTESEKFERLVTTAYAREAAEKKGMDESQITGAASSYARKYALNGLFLLDDTKDADTDEFQTQSTNQSKSSVDMKTELTNLVNGSMIKKRQFNAWAASNSVEADIDKLTDEQIGLAYRNLNA